jgi:regulator of sigma E protease
VVAPRQHGTEFAIAAIPLGGYVKFLDEREVRSTAERGQAFNNKTVWQRIAIVAAGPIANLLLCMALLWAMFVIGKQDYSATVGRCRGIAARPACSGDRIVRVATAVATLVEASMALTAAAMDRRDVSLEVETPTVRGAPRAAAVAAAGGFDERQVRSWPVCTGNRGCSRRWSSRDRGPADGCCSRAT